MLTKIRLENFRNWQKLDLELSNINILFGTNSSGKTSVLDALLLLKQTATGFDRYQPINLGGGEADLVDFGSYKDLVFGHNTNERIRIDFEWSPQITTGYQSDWRKKGVTAVVDAIKSGQSQFLYSVIWQQLADRIVVDQLKYEVLRPENTGRYLHMNWKNDDQYDYTPRSPRSLEAVPIGSISNVDTPVFLTLESCYAPLLSPTFRLGIRFDPSIFVQLFEQLMGSLAYLGPLRGYPKRVYFWKGTSPQQIGSRGENAIDILLSSERTHSGNGIRTPANMIPILAENVSFWLSKLDLVSEFKIEPISEDKRYYEPKVKTGSNQSESSLIDIGFGVSQVLPVITLLFFAPEGSIILIEQPEIHLHPSAQAVLADLFLEVAEKRNLQLIIESHSEHLLRRLQRRIAERKSAFANPEHIKTYFCKPTPDGSIAEPVEVDSYGRIGNWPENFFGDIESDMEAMIDAGLERRRQELAENG